jgi:hypothetical protein
VTRRVYELRLRCARMPEESRRFFRDEGDRCIRNRVSEQGIKMSELEANGAKVSLGLSTIRLELAFACYSASGGKNLRSSCL